jgi:hypothetical protein
MDKFMMMPKGFMGLPMDDEFITTAENKKNTQIVIDDWMLGPENPSNEPTANKGLLGRAGKAMQVDEKEARRRRCSNCEYYDNSTMTQAKMERIPRNELGHRMQASVATAPNSSSSATTCGFARHGKNENLRMD